MPRTVYLVVYNSPLFPAHWGLWIPQLDNPDVGKFIEAAGDAANGFDISFERNYDLGSTPRAYRKLPLADVLDQYVVDVRGDGSQSKDQTAHDCIEEVALSIPAPGRSLVSVAAQVCCSGSVSVVLVSRD
jgi:hypothetical protein